MRTLHATLLAGAIGLLAIPLASNPAEACLTCTSGQVCTSGSNGSSCSMEIVDGKLWCQFSLDCEIQITLAPTRVSPAGTYLAGGGDRIVEESLEKLACNGFVVGHTGAGPDELQKHSFRI